MAHLIYNVLPMPPRKIITVQSSDGLNKCIDLMVDMDIGALVVEGDNHQLVGIVSERDIVRSCLHHNLDLNTAKVSDIVYTNVSILSPHDTVDKAMQVISQTKRRHVLIRENDEFIAIVSIGDLLFHILDDNARVIEHLEQYINT